MSNAKTTLEAAIEREAECARAKDESLARFRRVAALYREAVKDYNGACSAWREADAALTAARAEADAAPVSVAPVKVEQHPRSERGGKRGKR